MHHCYILCTHTLLRNAINQIYANLFTNQFLPKVKVEEGGGVLDIRPYALVVHEFHSFSRRLMQLIIMNFWTCRGRGL